MAAEEVPKEVPLKTFKTKCENLEVLEEYWEKLEDDYRSKWGKKGV